MKVNIKRIILKLFKSKFFRFAMTGALGTITNLLIFFFICDVFKLPSNFGAIIAFVFAVTQNYFINHYWSFYEYNKIKKVSLKDYVKFVSVSLIGLGINLIILNLVLYFYKLSVKVIAQSIGILCGLIFNYFCSKIFVFQINKK